MRLCSFQYAVVLLLSFRFNYSLNSCLRLDLPVWGNSLPGEHRARYRLGKTRKASVGQGMCHWPRRVCLHMLEQTQSSKMWQVSTGAFQERKDQGGSWAGWLVGGTRKWGESSQGNIRKGPGMREPGDCSKESLTHGSCAKFKLFFAIKKKFIGVKMYLK